MIMYVDPHINLNQLTQEIREICRFSQDQVFTMKWMDEEALLEMFGTGEPIKSQNQPSQISVHAYWTMHALYSQKLL
ncbi:unnamed protein product [Timema podura]|uniref:Uncharacterized protein n=1 Tax=Timema podura TaxID=61482 RepID=A0ABN7PBD1_TIMPD|nr:unnamed protein product [Timema podura]